MVGFKAKARAPVYFTKLGWERGCVFVSGVCVCEREEVGIYVYVVRVVGVC